MSLHDISAKTLEGEEKSLGIYMDQVVLVVNTASECSSTPQYAGLEALWREYKDKGFVLLGFPSNDFGGQEPGSDAEIGAFCKSKFGVTFPMFSKISVKGDDKTPLYQFLTDAKTNPKTGGEIQWNFTKFLVDRNGKVIQRFEPAVEPNSKEIEAAVEAALK